jgi:hypothetical protein
MWGLLLSDSERHTGVIPLCTYMADNARRYSLSPSLAATQSHS